jgi:hypothetical protein
MTLEKNRIGPGMRLERNVAPNGGTMFHSAGNHGIATSRREIGGIAPAAGTAWVRD